MNIVTLKRTNATNNEQNKKPKLKVHIIMK